MTMFENGSKWLKADFHLHTCADREFTLPDSYNQNEFVKDYVTALKAAGIGIGVVTNHNKFDVTEYKTLKRAACKEGIFILPGVELSVNDGSNGVHVLIVFDLDRWCPDSCDNYVDQFLTAAFEGIHNRENANARCNYDLVRLLEKLDEHRTAGRDSFIIMAHVEQNSGFLHELDGGRISQLVQNNKLFRSMVLAFQKLRTRETIAHLDEWYGNHSTPAFVEGSDCKAMESVGIMGTQRNESGVDEEKACYIKIGDFNYEAVKYALKDKDNRTSDRPVELTNGYVKSISFIGGGYDNQKIAFSREMNCIIGIRGSGKSAILEVLRDALGIDYGAKVADQSYKEGLIEFTLGSGGKAIIELETQGHSYRCERIYKQSPALYEDSTLIAPVSIDTLINKPIYFGQKDLSSSGLDFEADLVRRLTGGRLDAARSTIEGKRKEIHNIVAEIKKIRNVERQRESSEVRKKDVEHKLSIFKEKGVEDKLKTEANFGEDAVKLSNMQERLSGFVANLQTAIDEYDLFFNQTKLESVENQDLFARAMSVFDKFRALYGQLVEAVQNSQAYQKELRGLVAELSQRKEQLKEEFAKIRREINIPQINPDDFAKLSAELKTLELKLKEIERSSQRKDELKKGLDQALTELTQLWHNEYTSLRQEIDSFNSRSDSLIIEIEFQGRKDKFKDTLKAQFRGTNLSELHYSKIASEFSNFIDLYSRGQSDLGNILTDAALAKFRERFNDRCAELLTHRIEDTFTIKYHNKPLSEHSLGQRASALILFLLAQEDSELIIIDQPEDDLDNQTIYDDVIKVLRKLKGKVQFVFATHNANIPVLGDSEQVIACACENEKFHSDIGSVDNRQMQQKIVKIMEGGEEAFNRRKEIYALWKQ